MGQWWQLEPRRRGANQPPSVIQAKRCPKCRQRRRHTWNKTVLESFLGRGPAREEELFLGLIAAVLHCSADLPTVTKRARCTIMAGYFLEIVAALVASYLLTPAAAFAWLRSPAAPQAALQQRSSALARGSRGVFATSRSAAAGTCPDCDLCADPFCGCATCAATGVSTRMACGCESGCPGGCGCVSCPGAFAAHALGCSCDDCN